MNLNLPLLIRIYQDLTIMNSKAVSLIFALVYVSYSYGNKIISHTQEWPYTGGGIILPLPAIKNNAFPYADCDSESNMNRNCTIDLRTLSDDGGFSSKNKCISYFEDKGKIKSREGLVELKMHSLTKDKIIFSYGLWQYQDFDDDTLQLEIDQVIRIVDMSTCEYHEAIIPLNITLNGENFAGITLREAHFLHYNDDTMDIFIINKHVCSGGRCKVTINLEGQKVGKPVSYLPQNMTIHDVRMFPLTSSSSPNNFFALVHNFSIDDLGEDYAPENYDKNIVNKLMYTVGNGESTDVIDFLREGKFLEIDDTFGKLGICWADNSNATQIICRQYSSNNEKQTEVTFPLLPAKRLLQIRNTKGGGFHLLIGECTDEKCKNHKNLVLTEIGSDGQIVKSVVLNSFTCVPYHVLDYHINTYKILEEQKNNLCVSKTCINYGKINLTRQCFDKNDKQ